MVIYFIPCKIVTLLFFLRQENPYSLIYETIPPLRVTLPGAARGKTNGRPAWAGAGQSIFRTVRRIGFWIPGRAVAVQTVRRIGFWIPGRAVAVQSRVVWLPDGPAKTQRQGGLRAGAVPRSEAIAAGNLGQGVDPAPLPGCAGCRLPCDRG